jgi:hypothetical protein
LSTSGVHTNPGRIPTWTRRAARAWPSNAGEWSLQWPAPAAGDKIAFRFADRTCGCSVLETYLLVSMSWSPTARASSGEMRASCPLRTAGNGRGCECADRLRIPAPAAQRQVTGAAAAMPTDVRRRPLQASRQMSTKQ